MDLFNKSERSFAETVSDLTVCNPFSRERIALERRALGKDFQENQADWNRHHQFEKGHPNLESLLAGLEKLTDEIRPRFHNKQKFPSSDLQIYEDCVLFLLYHRYREQLYELIQSTSEGSMGRVGFYHDFRKDVEHHLGSASNSNYPQEKIPHVFACFYQIRRAFYHIFTNIIGSSETITHLRATVWESIFTHDIRRFRDSLYDRMGDFTTLITGPSGTGKELVARAIGLSRYIPFNTKTLTFSKPTKESFIPLNLSALSPTLIESELFGHRRGSFTGAFADHTGWLEICPPHGTVFLDEIGELSPDIQVKLLRVLQDRTFQRLGESEPRYFRGKIIAATNRDLAYEMSNGKFRRDFYYRLCSDLVTTPSLHEQLAQAPEELKKLIQFIISRISDERTDDKLVREILTWINSNLGPNYSWPGNFRELEQCIRNILIHRSYQPPNSAPRDKQKQLLIAIENSQYTAEELLQHYCYLTYQKSGTYKDTAQTLNLDQRTVKAKVEAFTANPDFSGNLA